MKPKAIYLLVSFLLAFLPVACFAAVSQNVVIIGGTTLDSDSYCGDDYYAANNFSYTYGGCLLVSGPAGELGDFNFSPMSISALSAASLAPFDTAVLNMATYETQCSSGTLTAQQRQDLINFVGSGKKLIIFDSECWTSPDYSWLPYPFTTSNPGAMGAYGTLTIVEENTLSSNNSSSPYYIDEYHLGQEIDAVGDMNVMTTHDANWCLDMTGTNVLQVSGPVHTYAKYPAGTDTGLIIYNGLDQDYMGYGLNDPELRKIWVFELQQQFNPSTLPCGYTVVGITLTPASATNSIGTSHTVTATTSDLLKNPLPGQVVTISIIAGPNAGSSVQGTTNAQGQVLMNYTGYTVGTDQIEACFMDSTGAQICSQIATKEWIEPVLCGNGVLEADEECEVGIACEDTSLSCNMRDCKCYPVTFAEEIIFTATPSSKKVTLQWTAVSETDVLGYNILRRQISTGNFEKINNALIEATGSPQTSVDYEFIDTAVRNGVQYEYRLLEIQTDGATRQEISATAMPRFIYIFTK